ncbi:hypothetical protein ACLB2K_022052 [Fragaria x ananassa]
MASLTLKGQELVYDTTLYFVNSIDFSSNNLEGVIPEGISSLINLGTLNLSRNQLTGIIPSKIGNLRIPSGNQLQTLVDSSIYVDNPFLCGVPLSTLCPGDGAGAPADPDDDHHNDENGKFGMYVSAALGFIIGFWSVCGTLVMKKSWRNLMMIVFMFMKTGECKYGAECRFHHLIDKVSSAIVNNKAISTRKSEAITYWTTKGAVLSVFTALKLAHVSMEHPADLTTHLLEKL